MLPTYIDVSSLAAKDAFLGHPISLTARLLRFHCSLRLRLVGHLARISDLGGHLEDECVGLQLSG